jgi:aspartyl-tRNA(Asn)/glutamyl-tRNA(Gln) amidotransferase subunit A
LTRSAADCAIVLEEISGHDSNDTGSLQDNEAFFRYARPQHPLRVGVLTNAWKDVSPEIAKITSDAISVLRSAGAAVGDAALPEGPWEAAAGVVISVEGASAFDTLIESGRVAELTDPLGKIGGYINQTVPGSDYERALRLRTVIQRKIDELFSQFDVLAAASLPIAATPMSTNLETDLSFADPLGGIGNFCGLPALSVPSGFTSKNLPVGIQFVGRALDDDAVVAAAELFQSKTNWHRRHPQL